MYKINMQQEINIERSSKISKPCKKLLALMCIERQFSFYEKVSQKKEWSRILEYRLILDNCWKNIINNQETKIDLWHLCDKNNLENLLYNKSELVDDIATFCSIFIDNLTMFVDDLIEGNGDEESYLMLGLNFIETFLVGYLGLNELNVEKDGIEKETINNHELVICEINYQNRDYEKVITSSNLNDVKDYFFMEGKVNILGDYYFNDNFNIK